MLRLQPIEKCLGRRVARQQEPKQPGVFLRMVKAFRKRVDVVNHRAQQGKVRLGPMGANFTHEVQEAMQDGRQSLVFLADDADRLHGCLGDSRTRVPVARQPIYLSPCYLPTSDTA